MMDVLRQLKLLTMELRWICVDDVVMHSSQSQRNLWRARVTQGSVRSSPLNTNTLICVHRNFHQQIYQSGSDRVAAEMFL